MAIYHWRNDTRKPLLGWEFFLTSIIVVIIILLDCGLGDAQPVFGSPIAFKRTWLYYVEAALSFGGLLFLELLIFRIYLKSWQRNARWWKNEWFQETDKSPRERDEQFDEICDQARIVSGTLAFAIHIVALLMVEGDLLYEQAIAHDASLLLEDGVIVSAIYQIGVFLWPVLMTVGFAPEPILRRVLQPWQARATGRLRQWQRDVAWLWDCYRLALPGMPPAEPGALRSAIETARCRLLGQPVPSITPEDEAQVLIGRIRVRQPSRGQRLPVPARSRVRKRACGARLEPAVARSMAPNRWSLALKMVGECARAARNLGLHVQDRTNVDTVKHYVAVAKNLRSLLDERDRDHLTL